MEYESALSYILNFTDYEQIPGILYTSANYDLRRMEEILRHFGSPHLTAKSVHIAGTKGKGSTAVMIASALTASGYRTGLFTSPHLHTMRERIQIDGEAISEAELTGLVERLQPDIEALATKANYGQLTTFEVLTTLAFIYFNQRRVDFQVLEVGLGGRLDATNVVTPEVCVITSISLDHMAVLGNTLADIAAEKTGIIKHGCVVVSAPQEMVVSRIVSEVCHKQGVRLIQVGDDIRWQRIKTNLSTQSLEVTTAANTYEVTIPLLGEHQLENAATAVAALEVLAGRGMQLSDESIKLGLAGIQWPGRLQILRRQPLLIVDGAHNAYSARKLRNAIEQYFNFNRSILVIGTSIDKDIPGIVRELAPFFYKAIATGSHHPRAATISMIAAEFAKLNVELEVRENVATAISHALAVAGEDDLICVTGSLFVVAEAIECMNSTK